MIITLLILSIALFCWSIWQSGHLPDHDYNKDAEPKQKEEKKPPTPVFPEFIETDPNEQDTPTVVMVKK